jgi:hypothetical protein
MSIEVTSNASVQEQVKAAQAPKAEEKQSAPVQEETLEQGEIAEESEASETGEDLEAKSDEQNDSDEAEDQEEEKGKAKSQKGVAKKIGKLTKRLSLKDQEIEALKQELAKHSKPASETSQESKEATKPVDSDEPDPDNFDSHKEYVKAVTKWTLEQDKKAEQAKAQEEQKKSESQKVLDTHNQRVQEFMTKASDYKDVVTDFLEDYGSQVSAALEHLVVTSELGPQITYELAKNPQEFERLSKLDYAALAKEIGKIEGRLSEKSEPSAPEKKIVSSAPRPLTPVNTKGSSGPKKSIFEIAKTGTQEEYEAARKQMSKRA